MVLEIGAVSGYQAGVLAQLVWRVISVDHKDGLLAAARERSESLGVHNVRLQAAFRRLGWPEEAPYDAILVTAGAMRAIPAIF